MTLIIKDVPKDLNLSWEISFWYFIKILSDKFVDLDFKEVDEKNITQSMVNNLKEMKEEISKNWLKNFTSISS